MKPAPMADDVLELTRKCAEAMGYYWPDAKEPLWLGMYKYEPSNNAAQAFELLCWLAGKGDIKIMRPGIFHFRPSGNEVGEGTTFDTPAELHLAIMRAVARVKENQDGR